MCAQQAISTTATVLRVKEEDGLDDPEIRRFPGIIARALDRLRCAPIPATAATERLGQHDVLRSYITPRCVHTFLQARIHPMCPVYT